MDILNWLTDRECLKISSFGNLIPQDKAGAVNPSFIQVVIDHGETDDVEKALQNGPYGRCVYRCDNDVVDNQAVIMEYEGGLTASLIMSAFNKEMSRTIKIMGVNGEIRGHMERNLIEVTDFKTGSVTEIKLDTHSIGHGGGDEGLIKEFISQAVHPSISRMQKGNRQGILGHLMSFAAEKSRIDNKVLFKNEFQQ